MTLWARCYPVTLDEVEDWLSELCSSQSNEQGIGTIRGSSNNRPLDGSNIPGVQFSPLRKMLMGMFPYAICGRFAIRVVSSNSRLTIKNQSTRWTGPGFRPSLYHTLWMGLIVLCTTKAIWDKWILCCLKFIVVSNKESVNRHNGFLFETLKTCAHWKEHFRLPPRSNTHESGDWPSWF